MAKGRDIKIVRAVETHVKAINIENWNYMLCSHGPSKCSDVKTCATGL